MRRASTCWTVAALAALVIAGGGCQAGSGERCATDGECAEGLVCNQFSLRCAAPADICENDTDCARRAESHCGADFVCELPPATPEPDVIAGRDVLIVRDLPQADFSTDVDFPACPPLPSTMYRATTFLIGADGRPGNGLDIDGDPATCAPVNQCEGGVDNALATLGQLANPSMSQAVAARQLNVLFDTWPASPEGCPFLLLSRGGEPVDAEDAETAYLVVQGDESGDCAPGARFEDACLVDGTLSAGRYVDTAFPLALNVMGMVFRLPLHQARVVGTASEGLDGATLLIGGWVRRRELYVAIENVPEEQFPQGVSPGLIIGLVDSSPMVEDLDTDGDGEADALSAAIVIELAPVPIAGFAE